MHYTIIGRLLVALAILTGYTLKLNAVTIIPEFRIDGDPSYINQWVLIGPFQTPLDQKAINEDFIKKIAANATTQIRSEDDLAMASEIDLLTLLTHGPRLVQYSGPDTLDLNVRFNRVEPLKTAQSAAYVLTRIAAERERDLKLVLSFEYGCKVWLNGKQIFDSTGYHSFNKPSEVVDFHLVPGINTCVVKVDNVGGRWQLNAMLTQDAQKAFQRVILYRDRVLDHYIIPENGTVKVASPVLKYSGLTLNSPQGTKILEWPQGYSGGLGLNGVPLGLYKLRFSALDENDHGINIIVGSTRRLIDDLQSMAKLTRMNPLERDQSDVYIKRLEILEKPFNPKSNEDPWAHWAFENELENKKIYAATQLNQLIECIKHQQNPIAHQTGLHLKSFRSNIDGAAMNYRLFVPDFYKDVKSPLPVVIVMQTVFVAERPYLESAFVASHWEANEWAIMATKLGVAILWPGYRVCPYGNPIDFTHYDEVIEDLRKDYNIDPTRLYLYGYCSAGVTTSMEIVRNPTRYAAAAFVNPVLRRIKNRFDDTGEFAEQPAYQLWLRENDPIEKLAKIPNMPIWIIHDEVDPAHGPLAHTQLFARIARANHNTPRIDIGKPPADERIILAEKQMQWMLQHSRPGATWGQPPTKLTGPMAYILAERFTVIQGTQGTHDQQTQTQYWTRQFLDAWRLKNHTDCFVINDTDLTDSVESSSNLVLIGNAETNSAWRKFQEAAKLSFTSQAIRLDSREWKGEGLAIQTWVPNPKYDSHKVIFIGAADLSLARVGTMELEIDGWFDYAVWKHNQSGAKILEAGINE